jgi:hypothetical protein
VPAVVLDVQADAGDREPEEDRHQPRLPPVLDQEQEAEVRPGERREDDDRLEPDLPVPATGEASLGEVGVDAALEFGLELTAALELKVTRLRLARRGGGICGDSVGHRSAGFRKGEGERPAPEAATDPVAGRKRAASPDLVVRDAPTFYLRLGSKANAWNSISKSVFLIALDASAESRHTSMLDLVSANRRESAYECCAKSGSRCGLVRRKTQPTSAGRCD